MLKAVDTTTGSSCLAWESVRGHEFRCPECDRRVILKKGEHVIHHFAHSPGADCVHASGETIRHLEMKASMLSWFRSRLPMFVPVDVEVRLPSICRRADVVVNNRLVIECQASPMSCEEWEARTSEYELNGFSLLWFFAIERVVGKGHTRHRWPATLPGKHFQDFHYPTRFTVSKEVRFAYERATIYAVDSQGIPAEVKLDQSLWHPVYLRGSKTQRFVHWVPLSPTTIKRLACISERDTSTEWCTV